MTPSGNIVEDCHDISHISGGTNYLAKRLPVAPKSDAFGRSIEHFVATELRAFLALYRLDHPLSYWRSTSQLEVDFVVGNELAIEVKASHHVTERDLKGLCALMEEGQIRRFIVVSLDPHPRKLMGVEIMPWADFLTSLWDRALI